MQGKCPFLAFAKKGHEAAAMDVTVIPAVEDGTAWDLMDLLDSQWTLESIDTPRPIESRFRWIKEVVL
jgi:hypothetical protein